jgi:flavin reductase (DIM6/NTAB) family NADH-FMN oxidoreductase RutF
VTVSEATLMAPRSRHELDPTAFADAMRRLPSGVVMVTVRVGGRPWGLTISSCSSLSAEPPQILISLGSKTVTCREILSSGRFGISVLGADHRHVATLGAAAGVAKFVDEYCSDCYPEDVEMPRVQDALHHLDCTLVASHEHADHTVIVGAVERAFAGAGQNGADPLIYFDRTYRRIGDSLA